MLILIPNFLYYILHRKISKKIPAYGTIALRVFVFVTIEVQILPVWSHTQKDHNGYGSAVSLVPIIA
jgi:hypothetical protein